MVRVMFYENIMKIYDEILIHSYLETYVQI